MNFGRILVKYSVQILEAPVTNDVISAWYQGFFFYIVRNNLIYIYLLLVHLLIEYYYLLVV